MTVRVNVYEAKTNLSRLLEQVLAGERVIISRAGRPVADLVAHQGSPIVFGGLKDDIEYDESSFADADTDIRAMFDLADDAAS